MARHPTPEELGKPDLKVAGFQLWVYGPQFQNSQDLDDDNWLTVAAHSGAAGASVWVYGAILEVTDLVAWAEECEALINGRGQEAKLAPLEPELQITIRKLDRLGHFTMSVNITPNNLTQSHWFEFETDQTFLPEIVTQCKAIAKAYPVRGAPGK